MCFSPLAQGHGHGYDSAIFATVGNALNKGRVLYTEIVDNKGPLIYFIDALGLTINYDFGIFIIEFIFLFIGAIFLYKTAKIITKDKKWVSFFSTIFSMLLLFYTINGGNYTEEYAITFISIATYFVTKFLYSDYKLKWYELIIIGICFSATFLLRANLCAFFISQIIVVSICLIKDKKIKILFRAMGLILLGIAICLLPFLIYLIKNGALSACLDIVYFGVMDSFGEITLTNRLIKVFDLINLTNVSQAFTICAIAFLYFLTKPKIEKETFKILLIAFLGMLINLYANSLTGGAAWAYTHYFISFVPIIVVIVSWLFDNVYKNINMLKINTEFKNITTIILVFILIMPTSIDLLKDSIQRANVTTPVASAMQQYILDNTKENDTIQIINVDDTIYYPTNRIATSKHIYFAGGFSEERKNKDANELANDLYEAEKPAKIIMLPAGDVNNLDFINSLTDKETFIKFLEEKYVFDNEASTQFNCNVYLLA